MSFPLFPLNTVLFPGCRLDLQIFEARYLDMIGRCMKQNCGFGVVGIVEGEEVGDAPERYSLVGCEARIRDWQQRPNGLLGIRVEGGRRFRVVSANVQPDQLTVAEVEWLDEQPDQPLTKEHDDLAALLEALSMHPMVSALEMGGEVNGQQELACQLAYLLPFERDQKQVLLEMDDPTVRLARIQVLLEQLQGDFIA
ncbi:LON peptidase substrate-binding domain-containing protein [Pseudomonas sp. ZM23]|uniref:LON peptidase substrate-binding domain-containing protein n=1 Tax=Pseudomonas triclosanedens TaxID=2961893 RepID=A0ABY7A100_9PSED|nr:LON peptidase substrate-binding domain-containing protein [Pseudomonas triclosanedens]MCP8463962.1 LON peptidase substrate-binding domain-containing protein [Pseudomonas triclosanedens]MCP8469046.1 LON peptidase substrate-binding domain-containing protein [Pseudomonas triclosanedens]MCP8475768.1 LON peptidase substrate-binding domain-containing protein [Pseudomonas triclosanedens]WAI50527.1 LON peptidase substrate-binding domain-containing protein [Pseudomonas triclosanedens]